MGNSTGALSVASLYFPTKSLVPWVMWEKLQGWRPTAAVHFFLYIILLKKGTYYKNSVKNFKNSGFFLKSSVRGLAGPDSKGLAPLGGETKRPEGESEPQASERMRTLRRGEGLLPH